jgi:hypothetical protein
MLSFAAENDKADVLGTCEPSTYSSATGTRPIATSDPRIKAACVADRSPSIASTVSLDPGWFARQRRIMPLPTLNQILADELALEQGERLVAEPIGELGLADGLVVVRDPLLGPASPALARAVPPGRYAASLRVRVGASGERLSAAFLVVRFVESFDESPVSRWELGVVPGEDPAKLRAGFRHGFRVGSHAVSVLAAAAQPRLEDAPTREALQAALFRDGRVGVAATVVGVDGATIVACTTSGPGTFAVYWGLAESGGPVALVMDLNSLPYERPALLDETALDVRTAKVARELGGSLGELRRKALKEVGALGWERTRPLVPAVEALTHASDPIEADLAIEALVALVKEQPALRADYFARLGDGAAADRLFGVLPVFARAFWFDDAAVAQALVRRLEHEVAHPGENPRMLLDLMFAVTGQARLLPVGKVGLRMTPLLAHARADVRAQALRCLYSDLSNRMFDPARRPTADELRELLLRTFAASRDPQAEVRRAAVRPLGTIVRQWPSQGGLLLRPLGEPDYEVLKAGVEILTLSWPRLAEDLRAPAATALRRLAFDASAHDARRALALGALPKVFAGAGASDKRLLGGLDALAASGGSLASDARLAAAALRRTAPRAPGTVAPPPLPPGVSAAAARPRALFQSEQATLTDEPAGRLRLSGPGGATFDVEERRVFAARAVPRAGGAHADVELRGCLRPYLLEPSRSEGAVSAGPLSLADAEAVASRVMSWLGLPAPPLPVSVEELASEPAAFHGLFIEAEGEWERGPERSSFAQAWLTPPAAWSGEASAPRRVRVSGLWHAAAKPGNAQLPGPPGGGYGHLGQWRAELEAYELTALD